MRGLALVSVLFLGACGPSMPADGDGDGNGEGVDAGDDNNPGGPTGTIQGIVWAPSNAPGMVPSGQEIPIHDALIYVSPSQPAPIPQQTYCERCVEPQGKHTFSDHKGNFKLERILPGTYWVVIQKGQFRREFQLDIGGDQVLDLTTEQTTLPSVHNPSAGTWIPKMAVAVGAHDDLEDILGKMGIGQVDANGSFMPDTNPANLVMYDNGDFGYTGSTVASLSSLVSSLDEMLKYHIIYIPCSGTENTSALQNQQNLKNIRDYVDAGGKLYVTDWSGEWMDNVFPAQITLGDSGTDTPAGAYDANSDSWNTSMFGDADGSLYTAEDGEAADPDLHAWLHGQAGPTAEDPSTASTFDASSFVVEGNWNFISATTDVQVGTDDEGLPLYDSPHAWVIGSGSFSAPPGKLPLTVSFEPTGCGRVLFSTYHTTNSEHVGLAPQERVLLYLMMEIGVCTEAPIVE